jgi:hypothetical protein
MTAPAAPATGFLIDERLDGQGQVHRTTLRPDGAALIVEDDDAELGRISELALRTVMQRYGRPLDPEVVVDGPVLAVGSDQLRHLRYRAAVDAIARDYLVWESHGQPAIAALAVSVAAALRHLAMSAAPRG